MQRLKEEGRDPAQPNFASKPTNAEDLNVATKDDHKEEVVSMTKPGVTRKITLEELAAHANAGNPWFVVRGEVRRI